MRARTLAERAMGPLNRGLSVLLPGRTWDKQMAELAAQGRVSWGRHSYGTPHPAHLRGRPDAAERGCLLLDRQGGVDPDGW